MNEKLILVLSEHRAFGWKFNLYSAQVLSSGSVQILGIPNARAEAARGASEEEIRLIGLIEEVSDQELTKAYSKTKSSASFKNDISKDTFEHIVRPRIEINIRKVVELARHTDIPIYLREDLMSKTLYERYRIRILPASTQCVFNFVKDERGLRYFISLTNDEREISLQTKPGIIVTQQPCIVLLGDELHCVEKIDSKKLLPFLEKEYVAVPAASEEVYLKNFVFKTMQQYEVRMQGIPCREKIPEKQAILSLERDFNQEPALLLHFQYDASRINPGLKKKKTFSLEENEGLPGICWYERDMVWENQLMEKLRQEGLERKGDNFFYLREKSESEPYKLIEWLNLHREALDDFVLEQRMEQVFYTGEIRVQSDFYEKIDWFEVEIRVLAGQYSIPFSRFRKHILTGNSVFILPDKSVFILPEEWFHRYHDFFLHGKDTEEGVSLRKMHATILDAAITGKAVENKRESLIRLTRVDDRRPELPGRSAGILRPYQQEGFYWLEHLNRNGFGGCLADDMGLGKTIQTITLLQYVYTHSEQKQAVAVDGQLSLFDTEKTTLPASLIVAPTSLLHNWFNELKRFAPELKTLIYAGNKRLKTREIRKIFDHYQVVITSYGMVRNDLDYLSEYTFHYLILDESQCIKNPDSVIYKSVKQLYSSHKLALTGTPIENSLEDLWAQFNFINEGLLGNFSSFKTNYIHKITKEKNVEAESALQRLIQPFLLRRTKEEVTPELPPLSEEFIYCDMTEAQQAVYNAEKNSIRNSLIEAKEATGQERNKLIALQGLTRLRLLANHPALSKPDYADDSGKFEQILMSFETLRASGHKVLVFSSFVIHLRLLAGEFDKRGWKYCMLTGQTTNRQEVIEQFSNESDINCFFISLKAGGIGLNLTVADYVFIIDPWWNPAAEMQALSRAHRIGQKKNVIAYRFISSETIEEKIIQLQNQKSSLSQTFITSNNPLDHLNMKEIEELFL